MHALAALHPLPPPTAENPPNPPRPPTGDADASRAEDSAAGASSENLTSGGATCAHPLNTGDTANGKAAGTVSPSVGCGMEADGTQEVEKTRPPMPIYGDDEPLPSPPPPPSPPNSTSPALQLAVSS